MLSGRSQENRPGFSFCLSPDSELLRFRLEELEEAFPPPEGGGWKKRVFWGDDDLTREFWEYLTLQGLFAEPKILILRQAQNLPAEQWKALSGALGAVAASTWPVLCLEVAMERGKPKVPAHIQRLECYSFAEKKGWLQVIPPLDGKTLPAFVQKAAKRNGVTINPREAAQLANNLPPDAARVRSEMAKLALTAGPDGRLPQDAALLLDYDREVHIFELLSSIQKNERKMDVWRQILNERLGGDISVFGFTALLLREARILWQILSGSPVFLPGHVLAQKRVTARSLGQPRIAKVFDLVFTAEKGIKTGEKSPEQTFDKLIADLFTLFA